MAFVQRSSDSRQRQALVKVLMAAAKKSGNPKLSNMAIQTRVMKFDAITMALERMVKPLEEEQKAEVEKRDFCIAEFNTNEAATASKGRENADTQAKLDDAKMTIDELTKAIDELTTDIANAKTEFKRAGEDREKENKEFQITVADQRATQKLLTAALNILKGFYEKKAKAALLQTQQPAGPPPPPGFEAYKKNAAAGGVMGMIQQIINDAKAMEAETIRSEEDAQKAYEDFVKDTNASIEEKSKDIVNKSESKAKADLVEAKENKEAVMLELEQLANYKAELHSSCDFVMKNFEIRQTARDEEIEALKQAKAILSGAKFEAFLQGA